MTQQETLTITVVDYDPGWPACFEALRSRVANAVGSLAVSIEHVGSTSIPGLAAKPIIDMDVVVTSAEQVPPAIERLASVGYRHRGNLGIEAREAFDNPPGLPAHHLYLCVQGSVGLLNHLAVRDYLRRNAEAVQTYGTLKKQLAERFPTDIDRYIDGKTDFILGVLRQVRFPAEVVAAISDVNRIKS